MQKIISIDNFKNKKQKLKNIVTSKYEVAKYFLNKNALSVKELQILCFYAYSWYYALYEQPLFDNDFKIITNYPIDIDLKNKYKEFKTNKIIKKEEVNLDIEIQKFLDYIFGIYSLFHHLELYKLIEEEIIMFELNKNLKNDTLCIYKETYGNLVVSPTDVIYNIKIKLNNILEETEY